MNRLFTSKYVQGSRMYVKINLVGHCALNKLSYNFEQIILMVKKIKFLMAE